MEDGSGKCLLDVISDPSALNDFLINSQNLLDGDSGQSKTQPFQGASVLSTNPGITTMAQKYTSQTTVPAGSTIQHVANSKPPVSFVNTSIPQTITRSINGSTSITNQPRVVSVTNKSISPINNLANVTKGIAISPVSYQGKKPIPIQPKNPVILPNTSIPSGVNVRNIRHGLVSQSPTTLISNQLQMTQTGVLPRGHASGSINGVDTSKSRVTPIQTTRMVQPTILATPPKRIAPKQVLSPSTNPTHAMPSPMRLQQANIQNKQQLTTQLIQAPSGATTNTSKLYPQQLPTVVQPIANSNHSTSIVQSSTPSTAQPVQQIQQLINDKLSVQQTQPSHTGQVQQKVFSQAQLQTALKQSQLIAQNSPGQPQNILVQQHILKQLIQQAQQAQQQKQADKNVQPISTKPQGRIQLQQQQVKQTVQSTVPQQVNVTNQIVGNNQIQMVLPNQQVVTLTQNALSNQQPVTMAQNVTRVTSANLNQNLINKTQPMIIVSQAGGNFVLQQTLQPTNGGITTNAGTTVNIPLQNLLNHQQKQIQSQLTTTTIQQQPVQQQLKVAGNTMLQVQQPKQITQPTLLVQKQVIPGQTVTTLKQGVSQQNVVIQTKSGITTTQAGTTIPQLTQAQLQQLQNTGGVQKVFIIKQPEVLQKLTNVQGGKPQAIQITTQQLQALQQMQSQQTSTAQKIIIQSKGDGTNTSTTVLTAQQLKQLQQSLQQQVGSGKILQIPQAQRQTLVQQLQQQNAKTPSKVAHVPRILQTSGRQVISQVSTKTTTVKQEPSRGVKRPHAETPEPPKVVRRLKNALYQDQQAVTHPDVHTAFKSKLDAVNKLRCYHVYHDPGQTPSDIQKSELLLNTVSTQLMKKSEKMMEKYRSLILDESMRKEPSSEMVMLYRLFLADERAALAQDKKQIAEELKALRAAPKIPIPPSTSTTITNTTTNIVEKPPIVTPQPVKAKPKTPPPTALEEMETTEPELDILNTDSILDNHEDSQLIPDDDEYDEGSDVELEESEIDKAVFNMESSALYYKPVNHLSDSLIDSPRNSTGHDGDESGEELLVDDDAEKEDVTATLALLHSMAEELDGSIS